MLFYYEEVQTHPLTLFQYALLKYFLRCQFIKNISGPGSVITQRVGAGGMMATIDHRWAKLLRLLTVNSLSYLDKIKY